MAATGQKVAAVVQMAVLAQKLGHFEIINKRLLMGEISRLGDMWGWGAATMKLKVARLCAIIYGVSDLPLQV